jgi:hypothetical protein
MATERQIPGWQYLNETGSTQQQIPGGSFVNETVAGGGGTTVTAVVATHSYVHGARAGDFGRHHRGVWLGIALEDRQG